MKNIMPISLNVSHDLYTLSASLAADLKQMRGQVFQPQYVVTQTTGMNNWLKIHIAGANQITANIRFERPNDMIYQIYFKLDGPKEQVLESDHLQWLLFSLLDDPAFTRRFPAIAAYFAGDELRRLGLAEKTADLFDQYQIYRPEMIGQWNAAGEADRAADWQCWLWSKASEKLAGSMPDKTILMQYIREALQDPEKVRRLQERLPAVHLFGLSILSGFHIDIFQLLAEHLPVCFYLLNPSPGQYWYEDRSEVQVAKWLRRQERTPQRPGFAPPTQGNDLLTSWGRVLQDTFGLLFRHDDLLNSYTELSAPTPEGQSLLGKIQQDIFENAVGTDRAALSPEDLRDGSLSFHACYTPAREVEALYNYLVRLADRSSAAYSPRDIVVMVSNIDTYAPYIKAVFGSAPYAFPFTIADESYQAVDGFFSTLQTLMDLREDSFRAEDVLQLLELRYVRERFRITDTAMIRKVVAEANIRFGVHGDHADDSDTVSWFHGLDRLIYGICLHGDEPYLLNGEPVYPLDRAEGGQAFELIRFAHFIKVLVSVVSAQNRPRTIADWISYLAESVSRLIYEPGGEEDQDYTLFVQQLERLNLAAEQITETISFAGFRQHFVSQLSSVTKAGSFLTGGITFCSLIPMRSIPFRTVCLLGLNFDQFPRRETTLSFNILQQQPRKGDRNVKENDKHLFLETLLSARETLYISYIGRSSKDNSSLPPSAMVDELLDYIAAGAGADDHLVRQQLVQLHPLHGFSQRYTDSRSGLYTYLGDGGSGGLTAAVMAGNVSPSLPEANLTEISLGALVAFYKNPFKYFYNKVFSVYEDNEEVLLADTEVFELNRLQHWQLKHDLLLLPEGEMPAYLDRGIHTGKLPLSRMGELTFSETAAAVQPVRGLIAPYTAHTEPASCSIALQIGDHTLTGTLTNIYGQRLLVPAFSKSDRKYHLECWIKHLAATAAGLTLQTYYIAGNEAKEIVLPAGLLTPEAATARLKELIALFISGHERPLLFLPGKDIPHEKLEEDDDDAFLRLFTDKLISGYKVIPDPYVLREYQQGLLKKPGMLAEWRANLQTILTPFAAYFE